MSYFLVIVQKNRIVMTFVEGEISKLWNLKIYEDFNVIKNWNFNKKEELV
jgi:hypothetical protein